MPSCRRLPRNSAFDEINPSVFGVNAESTSPKVEAIYAPLFIRAKIRRRCVGTPTCKVKTYVSMLFSARIFIISKENAPFLNGASVCKIK